MLARLGLLVLCASSYKYLPFYRTFMTTCLGNGN